MLIRKEIEGMDQMELLHKVVVQDKEANVVVNNIKKFKKEFEERFGVEIGYRLNTSEKGAGTISHVSDDEGKPVRVFLYTIFPKEDGE